MKVSGNLHLSRYAYAEDVAKRRLGAAGARRYDVAPARASSNARSKPPDSNRPGSTLRRATVSAGGTLDIPVLFKGTAPDLVLWLDVIEHLASPGLALDHIVATMAPGATLLITTPNPALEPQPAVGIAQRLSGLFHAERPRSQWTRFPGLAARLGAKCCPSGDLRLRNM